ncbi:MAG TPA: class I SAM-dependent methyltransferase [Microthrixaceae bacterium]|nr:class I SAM-dependent methyltransferase [Microthrixaceae bacterium]MCB9401526.1 class I SAM-dependent methyltransferase [Microthrixaceae bacterium]MCO5304996.1 class I SAM-dependent methyltransferase [Microthrixaceae bacterium]HPG13634.1 class I SAM-dependent methyltransferase [Microthrixaceae bacterium]HRW40832.1 class I SAM-dependent methyltransferase [Microthrixaceae bacterium]
MTEALNALRRVAASTDHGYVELQTIPYRAHHLLAEEALSVTRPGDRVFEGGVSSGYFARVLVESGRRVDGHELDPAAAEEARAVCEKVHEGDLQIFDADELDGPYQLMLFGDTLEHVPDPASVLRRLRSQLADDGHLVVSIPNIANWTVRLQLLFGRFRYTDRGILDRTHLRFYTVATLPEMLADAGFSVVKLQASVPVPGVTGEALARVAHRVGNLRPGFFGYNLIATCTKGS